MSNLQDNLSVQLKKLRGKWRRSSPKRLPRLSKGAPCLKVTADTTSRLDALIGLLVSKGIITEDELKAAEKRRETTPPPAGRHCPRCRPTPDAEPSLTDGQTAAWTSS